MNDLNGINDMKEFSKTEYEYYEKFSDKFVFSSPEEEYEWAKNQKKKCIKCYEELPLIQFKGNTSGAQPHDKYGHRLRRGECIECGKEIAKNKNISKKNAKKLGISYKATKGTKCEICGRSNFPIVFDHDHYKNNFRGWLCDPCNRSIGVLNYESDNDICGMIKVINYLLKNEKIMDINGNIIKELSFNNNILLIEKES